jgi:micrococcal nuclease
MRCKRHKIIVLAALFVLLANLAFSDSDNQENYSRQLNAGWPLLKTYNYGDIAVKRVVDGDTLILENNERVRLIGIDTPEMHESDKLYRDARKSRRDARTIIALGRRSWEFAKKLVEGKRIRLEFDVERRDRYHRLLAYVFLKDGIFVNAEIVKQGYASLLNIPPNVKYTELFQKLYLEAREARRGLWK